MTCSQEETKKKPRRYLRWPNMTRMTKDTKKKPRRYPRCPKKTKDAKPRMTKIPKIHRKEVKKPHLNLQPNWCRTCASLLNYLYSSAHRCFLKSSFNEKVNLLLKISCRQDPSLFIRNPMFCMWPFLTSCFATLNTPFSFTWAILLLNPFWGHIIHTVRKI